MYILRAKLNIGRTKWRREGDLNSRGKIPHDFQSCAIPGYAPKPQWRRLIEKQFRFNHYGGRFKITIEKQQTQNVIKSPRL